LHIAQAAGVQDRVGGFEHDGDLGAASTPLAKTPGIGLSSMGTSSRVKKT
jgi:hypothetical protein